MTSSSSSSPDASYSTIRPLYRHIHTCFILFLSLRNRPGCSSLFGAFYLNGPFHLDVDLVLHKNPGAWNRLYGMLFIDQPIGTGFSITGKQRIPSEELSLAADLYRALQGFYAAHPAYAERPLYITGEARCYYLFSVSYILCFEPIAWIISKHQHTPLLPQPPCRAMQASMSQALLTTLCRQLLLQTAAYSACTGHGPCRMTWNHPNSSSVALPLATALLVCLHLLLTAHHCALLHEHA